MPRTKKHEDPRDQHPLFAEWKARWFEEVGQNPLLGAMSTTYRLSLAEQLARSSVYQDETVTHR